MSITVPWVDCKLLSILYKWICRKLFPTENANEYLPHNLLVWVTFLEVSNIACSLDSEFLKFVNMGMKTTIILNSKDDNWQVLMLNKVATHLFTILMLWVETHTESYIIQSRINDTWLPYSAYLKRKAEEMDLRISAFFMLRAFWIKTVKDLVPPKASRRSEKTPTSLQITLQMLQTVGQKTSL